MTNDSKLYVLKPKSCIDKTKLKNYSEANIAFEAVDRGSDSSFFMLKAKCSENENEADTLKISDFSERVLLTEEQAKNDFDDSGKLLCSLNFSGSVIVDYKFLYA